LLLVHNSFTSREDIQQVKHLFTNLFFCLCPNANLYIENTLPDVPLLMEEGMKICIGTDSLASNDQLCIYSELKTLQQHFDIDWELLLQWATYNGAQALRIEDRFGSLGIGMKPGIVHIYQDAATRIV
jgi:cytosine/adenosine deaminase-related metal-dependent hydrolase